METMEFYIMIAVTVVGIIVASALITFFQVLAAKKAEKIHSCEAVIKEKLYRGKAEDGAKQYMVSFLCGEKELIFEVTKEMYDSCFEEQKGILDYKKYEVVKFCGEKARVPISLIMDDPAPRISVYYEHAKSKFTADGRPLKKDVPNSLLAEFCRIVDTYGLKGKFSVVPMPGGKGYISQGIEGFDYEEIREWLDIARARLGGKFSFCPEMLTHAGALDLVSGELLEENEYEWSKSQTRDTLVPYISRALAVLKDVNLPVFGVSSPWGFGGTVENEYLPAIADAVNIITGSKISWVLYTMFTDGVNSRPRVAYDKDGCKVVSIPGSIGDGFWQTKDTTEDSEEYIKSVADAYISEDGTSGAIIDILEKGGYPIMLTHWQSMYSNGLNTGLKALELVADRVNRFLSDRVEWKSFEELMIDTLKEVQV